MNALHTDALHLFIRRWQWLLLLRAGVQAATVWLFFWGVIVLVARISGARETAWAALGLLGMVPAVVVAGWRVRKGFPAPAKIRASYDRLNFCGGIIMAEEAADMSGWRAKLPPAAAPKFRWHSGRALALLSLSVLFAGIAWFLPDRLTRLTRQPPLEIGQTVEQLQAEVKTLAQEKIIEGKKADELQKQLSQLQKDASSIDPDKTWEALDQIKQANSDTARQVAEEAVQKTESLTEAEALTKAMQQAAENGMEASTASQSAQDLASLLNAAKLEAGILNSQIPPELLQNLSGLDKERMQQLLQALALNKNALNRTMSNLANLKMIDPAALAKCQNAGHSPDFAGLATYLSQCKGGECNGEYLFSWLRKYRRGGPGGGGPEAPMMWDNDTSEDNLKFQEHALSPASRLTDAQLVGVSRAAPELSANEAVAGHGALDNAAASGGSAHTQVILPEHRQAVQNFFKRDEK